MKSFQVRRMKRQREVVRLKRPKANSEWWRRIPHPSYGHYGGLSVTCEWWNGNIACPLPIDWMDQAFALHDHDIAVAENHKQRKEADLRLCDRLKKGDPSLLARPVFGKLYRAAAIKIFKIA